jgi:diguanylate cyclase (GGDEF)-like protein
MRTSSDEFDPPFSEMTRRVLVIDDSEFVRRMLRIHLLPENIEFFEAADGFTGFSTARRLKPDLILLDLRLPGWDGFETIRRIKDDPITKSIPVIFLSAATDTAEKAKGLDLGAVDFVTKPFDPIELRARVRVALRTKYLQDLLEQRAHLDGLTGLGNRHALEERLEGEWKKCRQNGCPLSVLIADLDHFKKINDEYGHAAGDEILRKIASAFRSTVRGTDFVARYGGEEFVVLAPDCPLEGAVGLAERFRAETANQTVVINKHTRISVTVSVGISSTFDPYAVPAQEVLKRADQALYESKARGRNTVTAWTEGRVSRKSTGALVREGAFSLIEQPERKLELVG